MLTPSDYLGGVPVIIRLDDRDVTSSSTRPSPAAFVLPRTTMLLAVLPDVLALFSPLCSSGMASNATQVWLALDGVVPVDWTYPAGAVKDYVTELKRHRRAVPPYPSNAGRGSSTCVGTDGMTNGTSGSLDADALAPLELVLRIRQPGSAKLLEKRVPFFVNFSRLDEYMRNEVRQVHKAAYTAMYGSFKLYQNTPASALRSAEGLALYRPFHATEITSGGGATEGSGTGWSVGGVTAAGGAVYSSPHLVSDYQHLLHEALGSPPAAYLVKLGFPFAYCDAGEGTPAGNSEAGGVLTFSCHRVCAAPPLVALRDWTLSDELPSVDESTAVSEADMRGEAVTLGLLLWRLFRVPCLRWLAQQSQSQSALEAGADPSPRATAYGRLLGLLATRYYQNAPAAAVAQLERQDGLATASPAATTRAPSSAGGGGTAGGTEYGASASTLPPVQWAPWEAAMAARFTRDYDSFSIDSLNAGGEGDRTDGRSARGSGDRGLVLPQQGPGSGWSFGTSRIVFEVQGTQPLMETPAKFLETFLSSSDRTIYVTVRVM